MDPSCRDYLLESFAEQYECETEYRGRSLRVSVPIRLWFQSTKPDPWQVGGYRTYENNSRIQEGWRGEADHVRTDAGGDPTVVEGC